MGFKDIGGVLAQCWPLMPSAEYAVRVSVLLFNALYILCSYHNSCSGEHKRSLYPLFTGARFVALGADLLNLAGTDFIFRYFADRIKVVYRESVRT